MASDWFYIITSVVKSGLRYKVRTKLMEYKGHIYIPDLAPAA